MRYLRLIRLFFRLGALSEMAYRTNFFIHVFESMMSLVTGLSVLWVVFSRTETLGGWTWDELLVVLGMYFICFGLVSMMVAPSIKLFMQDIWKGTLDFLLTKPASHQFLATSRVVRIWNIVEITLGAVIVAMAMSRVGARLGVEEALKFSLMLLAGGSLLYTFWICLGTMAFWTTKLENVMLIFYNMYEAGRWPIGLYPGWLRYSLTFVIPVAFAVTFPAEAVIGRLSWTTVFQSLALVPPALLFARWFFNHGVRAYTGASA